MTDPTRENMLAWIADRDPSNMIDMMDREAAIYWFAADYHGGQWSNLYGALCRSEYKPGMCENGPRTFDAEFLYSELVGEFA